LSGLERNLAKVEVASSSLVSRSKTSLVVNDLGSFGGHEFGDSARLEFFPSSGDRRCLLCRRHAIKFGRVVTDGESQRESPERDARTRRDEARSLLAKGIDPRARRLRERAAAQVAGASSKH
jgi:hypothetical protein